MYARQKGGIGAAELQHGQFNIQPIQYNYTGI